MSHCVCLILTLISDSYKCQHYFFKTVVGKEPKIDGPGSYIHGDQLWSNCSAVMGTVVECGITAQKVKPDLK